LPRPFNTPIFDDYKNITDWTTGGFEPQWMRDFPPLSRLTPKPTQSPVQRILFPCQ